MPSSDINRKKVARALLLRKKNPNIDIILGHLENIGAGTVVKAKSKKEDGEKLLYIVSENGNHFTIYLNNTGTVAAIKNEDTGEWPVKSFR